MTMVNNVIGMVNYVIARALSLLNFVIADTGIQAMQPFTLSRGSPGAPFLMPGHGRRFPGMLFSPQPFRITSKPLDPKTPPPVSARSARDMAVRLVAHCR